MTANILDRNWKYVPASRTDIRKTFARIRKQMREAKAEKEKAVVPMKKAAQR